jgi:VanZ family protein
MRWELMALMGTGALVTAGCLVPNKYLPSLPNDKLMHFGAFALLMLLAGRLAPDGGTLMLAAGALLVAGWLIECLQNWVPGRSFSWPDLAANAAGILCAGLTTCAAAYFFG